MSILLWATGLAKNWATSKVSNFIASTYNDTTLEGKLSKAVEIWLANNSFNDSCLEALFNWYHQEALPGQPCRKELSDAVMKFNTIPSRHLWKGALMERYHEVRSMRGNNEFLQPLFELPDKEAAALFEELGRILHEICVQNLSLFTVTTHNTLQQIHANIEKLINQKPSEEIQQLLHNFSDFLNDRRVLYLSFTLEENYPLVAMTQSIQLIRQKLVDQIIPGLPVNSDERDLAKNMAEACRSFNDKIMGLRHKVLEDTVTPLYMQDQQVVNIIKEVLIKFRRNFIQPMFWLLTQFKVNIPDGILRSQENFENLAIPTTVYAEGIPVRTDKCLYYAGYQEVGYFLRICTLSEHFLLHNIAFPKDTEIILYDPKEVNMKHRIWQVNVGSDCTIEGTDWKKGDRFYFNQAGQLQMEAPVEKA